jgi:hypothetical protein
MTKWSMAALGSTHLDLQLDEVSDALSSALEAQFQAELAARVSARPLRELAFYTDYRHGMVMEPHRIFDEETVEAFLGTAQRWLMDLSKLVDGLDGIAHSFSNPLFRQQILDTRHVAS